MTVRKVGSIALICIASLGMASCTTTGGPNQTGGTLIGGAAGALIGSQFGRGGGALVGTAIGAVGGALVGAEVGKSMDVQQGYYSPPPPAPPPPGYYDDADGYY